MHKKDLELFKIQYDPRAPENTFLLGQDDLAHVKAQFSEMTEFSEPAPIPWKEGFAPIAKDSTSPPSSSDPLPEADYIVVTWTQAEVLMLANLMTPGKALEDWHLYDHNFASKFADKITDPEAPALAKDSIYYHKLGAYFPIEIGSAKVICFKSNLHMATDGPALPLLLLWQQLLEEVRPKLIITTGTAGAIGSKIKLGDALIASFTQFDCTGEFKCKAFAKSRYQCSNIAGLASWITADLLNANAHHLNPERTGTPVVYFPGSALSKPVIVTTDRFSFDNTTNSDGLQSLGNMCEMDDATLGLAREQFNLTTDWLAVRNASDPQMDGSLSPEQQRQKAAQIYAKYGYWTTVTSVIASWASICAYQRSFQG